MFPFPCSKNFYYDDPVYTWINPYCVYNFQNSHSESENGNKEGNRLSLMSSFMVVGLLCQLLLFCWKQKKSKTSITLIPSSIKTCCKIKLIPQLMPRLFNVMYGNKTCGNKTRLFFTARKKEIKTFITHSCTHFDEKEDCTLCVVGCWLSSFFYLSHFARKLKRMPPAIHFWIQLQSPKFKENY